MSSVKVINGFYDEANNCIRGVIDPATLNRLQVPGYQREVQPQSTISGIQKGYLTGTVPDVFLSMRGLRVRKSEEGSFYLLDPVFIVDGLQRISAALQLQDNPEIETKPVVGAEIHLGRDEKWEREMFKTLNLSRTKLSSNIIIRNAAEDNRSAAILLKLCSEDGFPMKERVCFTQSMSRTQLITAVTLLRSAGVLHSRYGATLSSDVVTIIENLDKVIEKIGEKAFRENMRSYYSLIRDAWGLSNITMRDQCPHIKNTFLMMLSTFVSRIDFFWDDKKHTFFIDRDTMKKMAQFNLSDSTVRNLCSATGNGGKILYNLFLEHMNKGRRTNKYVDRQYLASMGGDELESLSEEATTVAAE